MENETINIPPNPEVKSGKFKLILIIILSFLLVVVVTLSVINFFSSWQCINGEWLRNGLPFGGKPQGGCATEALQQAGDKSGLQEDNKALSEETPAAEGIYKSEEEGLEINSPVKGEEIKSPLVVEGRAKDSWYFEGSFPIKILNSQKNVLAEGYASAEGEWMSEGWVPFSATINFPVPIDSEGFLLLEKDNPSGLSQHAYTVAIPIKFSGDSGDLISNSNYIYDKCGGYPANELILGDCGEDCNTDNWKIYHNEKYGYSFRYPTGYALTNNCKNTNCVSEQEGGDSVLLSGDLSEQGWPMAEIKHFANESFNPPANIAAGEWIKEKFSWTKECFPNADNIYFSGKDGYLFGGFDIYFPASPQAYSRREIYYDYQGKIFQITMLDVNTSQARQFYDIWLSTFKVIGEK